MKIPFSRREEASARILSVFKEEKGLILSFASLKQEINLWPFNHWIAEKGLLALPRVTASGLELYLVFDLQHLVLSSWGILEPDPKHCPKLKSTNIDKVLVPGLGFDFCNHRIGYGKGYYDRLLPKCRNAKKIGIGFFEQKLTQKITVYPTDHSLDSLSLF